jgi:PKD repeat protein
VIGAYSDGPKPEGTAIVITVSQVMLELTDIFTYSFDWDNDGSYEILDQTNPSASHIWNDNGVYTVGVQVKDRGGEIRTANTSVEVMDLAPTAKFAWTPESQDAQDEGSQILFAAASTSSPDPIVLWSWDFGDTVGASMEQNPSYTYRDNGAYAVTLTVTDDDGSSTSRTVALTVNNVAPSVLAGTDQIVDEGAPVNLVPSAFIDPGAGDTHTATIDWGDDIVEAGIVSKMPSEAYDPKTGVSGTVTGKHTYADNGVYEVTITVTDDDGAYASDTRTVTVNNVAPSVLAGADPADQVVDEGAPVSLAPCIFIDPGTDDTHTAAIDWGDDIVEAGIVTKMPSESYDPKTGVSGTVTGKHIYADNGVYEVIITVTDDDGASASDTRIVTVNNVAPSVVAGVDQIVDEGASVSLPSSTFNDPGALDTHIAIIDWGDGTVEFGAVSEMSSEPSDSILGVNGIVVGSHVYANNGFYTVTLKVADNDWGLNSDTLTVTVDNQPPSVGPISISVLGARELALVVEVNTTIEFVASFEDPGANDTHTAEWNWGDGNTSGGVAGADNTGSVSGKHTYDTPGVYAVALEVTDDDEDWNESVFEYVVVYDSNDEFIAGGGWIGSTSKAYIANPELRGEASFGFVSKYREGIDTPTGKAELRFHVADLDFHSREYQWLMVTDLNVQFSGRGAINGSGVYLFTMTATDGNMNSGNVDDFRIRIWQKQIIDGVVHDLIVYESQPGLASVVLKQKKMGIVHRIFEYAMAILASPGSESTNTEGTRYTDAPSSTTWVVLLVTQIFTGIQVVLKYLTQ